MAVLPESASPAFYLDRAGTMRDLWKMLDSLDIYPSDRQPTVTPSAESIEIAAVGDHLAEISEPAESTVRRPNPGGTGV